MRSILIAMGLLVVGTMVGCADLLGVEPWEDKPLGEGSSEGGSTGDGLAGGGSTSSGGVDACHNGVQDGSESGVDCGGGMCGTCADARGCTMDSDCGSGYCPVSRGYCIMADGRANCGVEAIENPTCGDCVKNAVETDVDCGGDCSPCRQGRGCIDDVECWSGLCSNGICAAGAVKTRCFSNGDCLSGVCATATAECTFENCCR